MSSWCKKCTKKYRHEYYQRPKVKAKEKIRRNTIIGKKNKRKQHLKVYGITLDEYDALLKKQNGLCALCCKTDNSRRLSVDHNHFTDEVRGLLCTRCNLAIALLNEDIDMVKRVIKYLKR